MNRFASIAAFHIATACALAASDGPEVGVVSGAFSPYVRAGLWGRVRADLINPTDRARRVRFVYPTEEVDRGQVRYTRTVQMPPHTRRTIRLGRRAAAVTKDKRSARKRGPATAEQAFSLEDAITDIAIYHNTLMVIPLESMQACLAYVDTEDPPGQSHSFLGKIPDDPLGRVVLASSRQRRLPNCWYGFSLLRILLISAAEPSELLDSQVRAVLDWVGNGGVLVITSHSAVARTISGRLAEAAGVTVAGTHEEYRLEAVEKNGNGRFRTDLQIPMLMAQLCPLVRPDGSRRDGAEVLWEANGLPLLTLRRWGGGAIFVLAAPVGALQAEQARPLWKTIGMQMRLVSPVAGEEFVASAEENLPEIAGMRGPDRLAPTYIIAGQAALFLLAGLFLYLKRRGELAWVVLVPVGLLAAGGMLAYSRVARAHKAPRLSFLALAEVRPDGSTQVRQLSTYYAPDTEEIHFSSGSIPGTVHSTGSASTAVMQSTNISSDADMRVEGVRVVANSSRTAYAEAPVDLPGRLIARTHLGPKGLEGTITNDTGADIFDAVIIAGGLVYAVGDLPAGQAAAIAVNDPPLPDDTYIGIDVRDKIDLLRNKLLAAITYRPSKDSNRRHLPVPMLLGWTHSRMLDPLSGKDAESNGLTLITLPLALHKTPAKTKIVVPSGLLDLEIGKIGPPVWSIKKQEFNEMSLPAGVVFDFAPPQNAAGITGARAVLRIRLDATNWRMRIFGWTGPEGESARERLIKTINRPAGAYEVAVKDLQPSEDARGKYRIIVRIDRLGSGKSEKRTIWKIDSANLTLEGTSK